MVRNTDPQESDGADPGAPYPAHWEADVVLRDGSTAHLRPIRPEDADRIVRFHAGQSPESILFRFFVSMPRLSARDVRRFTHVDHVDRVALVCTVGEEIIGIARYDRVRPRTAEVAFNVSDAHRGRGLGSVLLEHLAAAARENGVRRFVAEVMPENRRMLSVFRDAGYEIRTGLDDGVISLGFDLDPTDRSLAVMESREHRAEARSLYALLNPASVVLVGASRRPGSLGHRLLSDLLAGGFTGRLHVVHPKADEVLGVRAHHSLAELPEPVDLAVLALRAEDILELVPQCARAGARGLVVLSDGFAETGSRGTALQRELVRLTRSNGMRLVGPNSWGIINTDPRVAANISLESFPPVAGGLGLFCQSGAMSVAVLRAAVARGTGISTFLSAGNRADVSGNDCMQYWEEDERTQAVGLYLESIGNPRKFSRIARRLARTKPVIVVKSGTSGLGVPPGHAVRSTRVPRQALDAMLRQSGCLRVENVHQLLDVARLAIDQPLPAGPRVGVVANSHALGTLLADACLTQDLQVTHGPVTLPVQTPPEELRSALARACAHEHVDSVVVALMPPLGSAEPEAVEVLRETARDSPVPVVSCLLGAEELREGPEGASSPPTYSTPEEAVRALAAVTCYGQWRTRDLGRRLDPAGCDANAARGLVERVLREHPEGIELDPRRVAELLEFYGIHLWPALQVTSPQDAVEAADRLGWPVVLKTTAPHLRHRVDLGAVRLDIDTEEELHDDVTRLRRMLAACGGGDLVVQRMAPAGVACVARTVEDPLFGPVVTFGLAGDAADLLGDLAHRIPPLTDVDVADLVRSVKAAPRLFGHRGAEPVDVQALSDVIVRISRLGDDLPEVAALELNPIVVHPEGAAVLGACARLAPPPGRTDAGLRRLTASP
ncbi:MAG: hypothetical protein QG608_966 [Actinomycetota bacterium]|nr:hypothetical protein [Actinomycetota bacterium]